MKRAALILALGLSLGSSTFAQTFEDYFVDKTLRLDYIFMGNADKQDICLDELSVLPQWAGRRHHLSELPLEGNGEITMKDKATGKVIYRTSFSSLFQEWIGEQEAKVVKRGFENTFLVPYPKQPAEITVVLRNASREVSATLVHEVNPSDILIHQRGEGELTPHRYLWQGGSSDKCIDVAIMAEGYAANEADLFYKDAAVACEALFAHEPFKKLKDRFNIVAVFSESKDSGVSIPRKDEWKKTAVSSHFDTFYSDRYLTTRSVKAIHNWLAGIPYEHIIILANTDTYGGGGIYNSYTLTTAHHSMFRPVVVHEFGHSFGGLADEYAYDEAKALKLYPYQKLFFSTLKYSRLIPLFGEEEYSLDELLPHKHVLLLTGIASPEQMKMDLEHYETDITPLSFGDHHYFSAKDVALINETYARMSSPKLIVTTEKDATRLKDLNGLSEEVRKSLYALPVEIEILQNQQESFNENITGYVFKNSRNSILAKK